MLEPTGFWSYTRLDDTHSDGNLSVLRRRLQQRVGQRRVTIFQDVEAIPFGSDWQQQIDAGINAASFFIPIVTPSFLQSKGCCYEVTQFHRRLASLGRSDLIFPLHYNDADDFADVRRGDCHDLAVRDFLWTLQHADFRPLRLRNPDGEEVRQRIAALAQAIYQALLRDTSTAVRRLPPPPPPSSAIRDSLGPAMITTGSDNVAIGRAAMKRFTTDNSNVFIGRGDNGAGPEMVLIPAGSFVMGISAEETKREDASAMVDDWARPQHKVTIARPFYMCKYPVTRGAFRAFARSADFLEDDWREPRFKQTDQHPVVNVSHKDAVAYAAWLSRATGKDYRLPSEAEWEYAARAGTTTARFWGEGRAEACRYANVADETRRRANKDEPSARKYFGCDDGSENTSPVGSFQPNGFGLYDMLGNVGEWTADWWNESYHGAPEDGSAWTAGDSGRRIVRGGSFAGFPETVRAGCRSSLGRGDRYDILGFRLARAR
jgi:formylglycine-generating enzyme required for sulfatase activity